MTPDAAIREWSASELYERLRAGDDPFVLDTRTPEDAAGWGIEGHGTLPTLNVPPWDLLADEAEDDVDRAIAGALATRLAHRPQGERTILAVCPEGDLSRHAAAALTALGFDAANLAGGMQAWGNFYDVRPVGEETTYRIFQIARPARGCLSWMVIDGRQAAVIDPLRHIDVYLRLAAAEGAEITLVIDTHGHADHISGGRALADRLGVPYLLHPYDGIHPLDQVPGALEFDYLRDGQRLGVGGASIEALHIPGHTLGNMALLLDRRHLFAGDSLFIRSVARPDLGGRADTWAPLHYRSLRRLMGLGDQISVLPGHFSSLAESNEAGVFAAPLDLLLETNDGLLAARLPEAEFVRYLLDNLPPFPDAYAEIKRVNAGLKSVDEARAAELELGKNRCALAGDA